MGLRFLHAHPSRLTCNYNDFDSRGKATFTLAMIALVACLLSAASASQANMRPNIIFLFIDDLLGIQTNGFYISENLTVPTSLSLQCLHRTQGWDDVSFHGSPQIPTPNMDVLAADGIILNNYYVQPACTPSRAALMTGLYPIHTGMQHSVLVPAQPYGLPLEVTIMPQHFKNLGYETHMIGKWNLGNYKLTYTPTYRGFDSFYGYYSAMEDYYNHTLLWDNRTGLDFWLNTEPLRNVSGTYSSHLYTERAKSLIENRDASKPLFLYLAYQSVHCGNDDDLLQAPQENIDKFPYIGERNRTIFAGMVDALDESIGEVFQALGDAGMLGNTIIVLSSDNGALPIGAHSNRGFNFPLRGGKLTLWEGGCRATGFIWSPLLKRKGVVSDQMMHITDWLPTLYSAAGGNPLSLGKLDGTDMWAPLSIGYASPRYEILYNIDPINNNSALRYTNYKLVLGITEDGLYDPRFLTTGGSRPYDDLDLLMVQSTAARVLRDLRNKGDLQFPDQWREKATLNCGNKVPKNFVSLAPPYLFDLASDPCEINNIARSQAGLVAFLRGRIQSYAQTAAATINQPTDPNGYPENLNGTWGAWIT